MCPVKKTRCLWSVAKEKIQDVLLVPTVLCSRQDPDCRKSFR